jgi:hypothetical protein
VPEITAGSYKVCVDNRYLKPQGGGGSSAAPAKGAKELVLPPGVTIPEGYTPSSQSAMKLNPNNKRYMPINEKYAEADTTDLTFTATGSSQTYDIELK